LAHPLHLHELAWFLGYPLYINLDLCIYHVVFSLLDAGYIDGHLCWYMFHIHLFCPKSCTRYASTLWVKHVACGVFKIYLTTCMPQNLQNLRYGLFYSSLNKILHKRASKKIWQGHKKVW
jgi:hypothetical protein